LSVASLVIRFFRVLRAFVFQSSALAFASWPVFIGDAGGNRSIPTSWIVGTFGYGHALNCIEVDLRAMAQERAHHSMMDLPDAAAWPPAKRAHPA
jgi:hypothetical protein